MFVIRVPVQLAYSSFFGLPMHPPTYRPSGHVHLTQPSFQYITDGRLKSASEKRQRSNVSKMSLIIHLLNKCLFQLVYPTLSSMAVFWLKFVAWMWTLWEDKAGFGFQGPWKHIVATFTLVLGVLLYKLLFTPYNRVKVRFLLSAF